MQATLRRLFTGNTNITNYSIKRWNLALFVAFLAQGVAILLFSVPYQLPVVMSFLTHDTLQTQLKGHVVLGAASHQMWVVNVAYLVALLLFVAAGAHLLALAYRHKYEVGLERRANYLRWKEYALGGGLVVITLGLLMGVYDVAALLLLFVLAALASLIGLGVEKYGQLVREATYSAKVIAAIIAVAVGLVPWVALGLYLLGAGIFGEGHLPVYLYWLYGSTLVMFVAFGINAYLAYAQKGKWANYLYAERWYMVLSLVIKSLVAWQIFAAVLHS